MSTTATSSLSPSRAGEFVSCALLFRYRTVDRLPEASSAAAVRGTLVHRVLEEVFDLAPGDRTASAAHDLLGPAWIALRTTSTEARDVDLGSDEESWLASAHELIDQWFTIEDPTRLEPRGREVRVEATLASGLLLRGIIDRVDEAPDGALRIIDYKTGSSPQQGSEARALFQLRIYGLILLRSLGVVARRLQLVYLKDGTVVSYDPDVDDLLATERKVEAIGAAIDEARRTGIYEPRRGPACGWCPHHAHCPVFGGTVLPLPSVQPASSAPTSGGRIQRAIDWLRRRGSSADH